MIQLATALLGPVVKGVTNIFTARAEAKKVKETLGAKLAIKKADTEAQIELSRTEWERLQAAGLEGSWKDEWVTLLVTAPVLVLIVGALLDPLLGTSLSATATQMITQLNTLFAKSQFGLSYSDVFAVVVFAALGLRVWRG